MTAVIAGIIAMALYLSATFYAAATATLATSTLDRSGQRPWLVLLAALALSAHGVATWSQLYSSQGLHFQLWPMTLGIFLVVNLIVVISSLRRPVQGLFIILFPLTTVVIASALLFARHSSNVLPISLPLGSHILFSMLAYSLFTIAAGQALLLAYQERHLKHHSPGGFLKKLPPLQTMEQLLFEVIWAGFALLSLALVSGLLFVQDFMAQHLAHKTVFSVTAWLIYAVLLWGRYRMGWRGQTAIRWTLGGFLALALAYWGSKFVLEVLLGVGR